MKRILMLAGLLLYLNPQISLAHELIDAVRRGNIDEVEILLATGADVNAKDNDGITPLHVASRGGHKDVTKLLLAKGANRHLDLEPHRV